MPGVRPLGGRVVRGGPTGPRHVRRADGGRGGGGRCSPTPPPQPRNGLLPCWMVVRCPHASRARSEDEGMTEPTAPVAAPDLLATLEAARGAAAVLADTLYRHVC